MTTFNRFTIDWAGDWKEKFGKYLITFTRPIQIGKKRIYAKILIAYRKEDKNWIVSYSWYILIKPMMFPLFYAKTKIIEEKEWAIDYGDRLKEEASLEDVRFITEEGKEWLIKYLKGEL